jgi:hypothetical protein
MTARVVEGGHTCKAATPQQALLVTAPQFGHQQMQQQRASPHQARPDLSLLTNCTYAPTFASPPLLSSTSTASCHPSNNIIPTSTANYFGPSTCLCIASIAQQHVHSLLPHILHNRRTNTVPSAAPPAAVTCPSACIAAALPPAAAAAAACSSTC